MQRNGIFLAAGAASLLMASGAFAAPALPAGAAVATGSASISSSGASMTVNQSTPKAIIDWSSFSIGQGGSVRFDNGSGATLNRVTGTTGSSIDGLLSGTGSVYLINPNGVIVGKGGVINVGGTFVASTLDVPNAGFLAGGDLTFSGPSRAMVVNEGKVGSLGGDVVLIASDVTNAGSLSAPNGAAGLLAGQSVLLRDQAMDGGKFSVLVGGPSTSATNTGLIEAANAELRANGGNIYALAGNTAGVIKASGVNQGDGRVWLIADGGTLDVAGTITARGPNGSGGAIETSGADVKIGASSIDAGVGGTWRVDPYDLTIDAAAANSISGALNAGTNVIEQTTASGASGYGNQTPSGNGDIFVQAPIGWSTGATLTLDAYRNVVFAAPITVSGAGRVSLYVGSGGHLDFGLGETGFAGHIDFTGAEGSGQSLAINGQGYALIYTMAELAALDGSAGRNVLAVSLTAGAGYSDAVVKTFNGTLEGLGHTINELVINGLAAPPAGAPNPLGLIGTLGSGGAVADLGLAGGTLSISTNGGPRSSGGPAGDLIGHNQGVVSRSYATGDIKVLNNARSVNLGGLVGLNDGTISWSFATGSQNASSRTGSAGGLAGASTGQIDHSYAAGDIDTFGGGTAGGLVGYNTGSISYSFATGDVSGSDTTGGLVGASSGSLSHVYATGNVFGRDTAGLVANASGSITDSFATGRGEAGFARNVGPGTTLSNDYWNTQTSGRSTPSGFAGVTGLTTAQLMESLPAGFSSAVWGQIPGTSYPYLLSLFPTTPQVISGHAYQPSSTKPVFDEKAKATVDGSTVVGRVSTGFDGFYYVLAPTGTLPGGSTSIVYLVGPEGGPPPAVGADSVVEHIAAGSSLTGVDLNGGASAIYTPDTTLSQTISDLARGIGPATGNNFGGPAGPPLIGNISLFARGPSFDFDTSANFVQYLFLQASGVVTQSAGAIAVQDFWGSSVGGLSLTSSGNKIGMLDGWADPAGAISIIDGQALSVRPLTNTPTVSAAISINLTTTSGDLSILAPVVAGSGGVILQSAGMVIEGAGGRVSTSTGPLSVTAVTGIFMNNANVAQNVSLQNSGAGAVSYTESGNLSLGGVSNASAGPITLATTLNSSHVGTITLNGLVSGGAVTLTSAQSITEAAAGAIDATSLQGSAHSAATLNKTNLLGTLAGFTVTIGGFNLTDGEVLTVTSPVTAGTSVTLSTTSGDLDLKQAVTAGSGGVTLASVGKVVELGSAALEAPNGTLSVTGVGGINLRKSNVAKSVALKNSGGGSVLYTELGDLNLALASNAGDGPVSLTTTLDGGGHGDIDIAGTVSAGSLTLTSAAAIAETGSGLIDASVLTGAAAGAVTLDGSNQLDRISGFTDTGGDFSLTDGVRLLVGALDGSGRTVSLTTTSGDIVVLGAVNASTLDLTSQAGALKEGLNGAITVGTLNATAHTGINLASSNNDITAVGPDHTDSGPDRIVQ